MQSTLENWVGHPHSHFDHCSHGSLTNINGNCHHYTFANRHKYVTSMITLKGNSVPTEPLLFLKPVSAYIQVRLKDNVDGCMCH